MRCCCKDTDLDICVQINFLCHCVELAVSNHKKCTSVIGRYELMTKTKQQAAEYFSPLCAAAMLINGSRPPRRVEARYCGVRRASHTLHTTRSKHFDAALNAFLTQLSCEMAVQFWHHSNSTEFRLEMDGSIAWSALVLHFLGLPTDRSNQCGQRGGAFLVA